MEVNAEKFVHDIWVEHEPYIRKLCNYKLKSMPNCIDDCIQDVFLDFLDALSKGKTIDNLKGWLTVVANNKIKDLYTKGKQDSEKLVSLTDKMVHSISDETPIIQEEQLTDEQLLSAKDSFFESLSSEERELFHERFVKSYKAAYIAELHGTTEINVRQKVFRLRKKAKAFAEEYISINNEQKTEE